MTLIYRGGRMKILRVRINWMLGWCNDPVPEVLVDKIPEECKLVYQVKKVGNCTAYFAECDGYVDFFWHNPLDEYGYGGCKFELRTPKGVVVVRGPWSSRSAVMNDLGFPHSMEVSITDEPRVFERGYTFLGGNLLVEKLKPHLPPGVEIVKVTKYDETSYRVQQKGTKYCEVCKGFKKFRSIVPNEGIIDCKWCEE